MQQGLIDIGCAPFDEKGQPMARPGQPKRNSRTQRRLGARTTRSASTRRFNKNDRKLLNISEMTFCLLNLPAKKPITSSKMVPQKEQARQIQG